MVGPGQQCAVLSLNMLTRGRESQRWTCSQNTLLPKSAAEGKEIKNTLDRACKMIRFFTLVHQGGVDKEYQINHKHFKNNFFFAYLKLCAKL